MRNGVPERKILGEMHNAKEFIRVICFLNFFICFFYFIFFKKKGVIGALKVWDVVFEGLGSGY